MANLASGNIFLQIWKFLLNIFEQGFQKIKILFDTPKLKVDKDGDQSMCKPFSELPGPKGWPILGNILEFNKVGGAEKFNVYAETIHKEYGGIVKVQLGPQALVFISDPAYYKEFNRQEGTSPKTYKLAQTCLFNSIHKLDRGLFFTDDTEDDPKWQKGRAWHTQLLLKDTGYMKNLFQPYENVLLQMMREWLQETKTNDGILPNYELNCYKIFLYGISSVCLGRNYEHFLREADVNLETMGRLSIEANEYGEQLNKTPPALARMLGLKLWKRYEEITLFNLHTGHRLVDIALKAMKSVEDGGTLEEFGLLHRLKNDCNTTDHETKVYLTDYLFDISEPVSISIMWALHALGRFPDVQEKLFQEIKQATDERVTFKDVEKMTYLKAAVKETQRLFPMAPFVARVTENEIVIGGYQIPPKTTLTLSTIVSSKNPEYFPDPERLWPERWFHVEGSDNLKGVKSKDAMKPWGTGKRSCAGKLLAQNILHLGIATVVQNFTIESEPVAKKMKMVLYPEAPIKIRLTPREKHFLN